MKCFKLTAVLRGLRKRFRSKTPLEQCLIIISTLLFIVFISLVLALIHNAGKDEKPCDKVACITEACLKQASNMLQKMNSSIDPCEDFYEYACGSYHLHSSLSHGKRSHTVEDDVEDELLRIIRDLLSNSNKTGKSSSFEKADNIYTSCMEGVDEFESIDQKVQMLLSESGLAWPKSSQSDQTSRNNIVKSIIYGTYPFYDLSVLLEDDGNVVFHLSKTKTGTKLTFLNENVYLKCCLTHNTLSERNHKNMLLSTLLLMFEREIYVDNDKDSTEKKSTLAENMIQLEKDLVKNISKLSCEAVTNTSHLEKDSIGWEIDVINALGLSQKYPSLGYVTPCKEYVNTIESGLRTYKYQFYLVWRFITRFLPFLSTPFRQSYIRLIDEGMNAGLAGNNQLKYFNERWKQCVHLTNYIYGLAIADAYIKDGYYKDEDKEVTSLIDSIKEYYHEVFASHSSMDNDTLDILARKLEEMTIDLKYPDDNLDNEKLDNYYEDLNDESSFLKTILKKEEIETKRRLNLDPESSKINTTSFTDIPPLSNVINMDSEASTLTLPIGLFRFPYYVPEFYKFAKYGGLASVIAREMYRGLHLGKLFDENEQELNFDALYNSRKSCYKDQYSDSATDEDKTNDEDHWEEVIFDNIAMKVAYALYRKDMDEEEDKPHLPGLDLSSDKLFFLHYAQMYCEIRNNTQSPFDKSISARFRVNNVMMNKKEFSEAFECKKETEMNPKDKYRCKLWE